MNGVLWDMEYVYCAICEIGLFPVLETKLLLIPM